MSCPASRILLSGSAVLCNVCARNVSQRASDKDVGEEMLLGGIARQTHSGSESVSSPFHPPVVRIHMRNGGSERKARRRVSRGTRSSAAPELSRAVPRVRELAVECEF